VVGQYDLLVDQFKTWFSRHGNSIQLCPVAGNLPTVKIQLGGEGRGEGGETVRRMGREKGMESVGKGKGKRKVDRNREV
jgi:hypothetical protein